MYDMMVLQNTTKVTYNVNLPRKNSHKTADIEIEDYHPYREEIKQNMLNNWILKIKLHKSDAVGVLDSFNVIILEIWI